MCNPVTTHRPDSLLEKGEHAGFEWEVTNNGIGYRCGYVRVPAGHPCDEAGAIRASEDAEKAALDARAEMWEAYHRDLAKAAGVTV